MLAWQIEKKVKMQMKLIKNKDERKILTRFYAVFYYVTYSLQNKKNAKFLTYYKDKLIFLDINEMQAIVKEAIKNYKFDLLRKLIKWLKVDEDALLIDFFTLYLKSLLLFDSIENFKFFYNKNYKLEANEISTEKFIEFLDIKIKINNKIKQIFKYQYGIIIDFINKNIGPKI